MAAIFGVSLLGVSFAPTYAWVLCGMFGVGLGSGGFQALNAAVIARETEPHYIGRVMSLALLAFAGFGLMALPYGILADSIGERLALTTMGGVVSITTLIFSVLLIREGAIRLPIRPSRGQQS
jgi:predicted MFS family arabinose efflux permease